MIRPVGQSGKLIQILDSVREPEVIDAEIFVRSPEWTGIALVPKQVNGYVFVLSGILAFVGILLLGRWSHRKFA